MHASQKHAHLIILNSHASNWRDNVIISNNYSWILCIIKNSNEISVIIVIIDACKSETCTFDNIELTRIKLA